MALLITKENRPVFVSAETAAALWLVKTGERRGTPKTLAKVNKIDKWYLNYESAPKSWKALYPRKSENYRPKHLVGQLRMPYAD